MIVIERFRAWWAARRPRPLNELLAVEFDDDGARVVVLDRLEPDWNQSFLWRDVRRVCFRDRGLNSSDAVFIDLVDRDKPVALLTEAQGAGPFLDELSKRGLFPEEVWRKAMAETSGRAHCWPEQ